MSLRAELSIARRRVTSFRAKVGVIQRSRDLWRQRAIQAEAAVRRMSQKLDRFIPREIDMRGHV